MFYNNLTCIHIYDNFSENKTDSIIELDSEEGLYRLGLRDGSILFSSVELKIQAKEMINSIIELQNDSLLKILKQIK